MTKNFLLLIGCFFLFSCAKQTPIASQNKNLFLENMSNVKNDHLYQHADHIKEFVFPRDHGAHNEFKTEWWYFTGNLSALKQKMILVFSLQFLEIILLLNQKPLMIGIQKTFLWVIWV